MIDICALGPLRITSGLFNAGLLASGAKVNPYYTFDPNLFLGSEGDKLNLSHQR